MKLSRKNLSIVFTLSLASVVTFALSVGQNIEIMEFLNARARANFIEPAVNNRVGVLTRGTHAEIQQVKRFKSGNSGLYIKVKDGPLSGQSVWVYYNKTSPSLRLASVTGTPMREPAVSGTGVTTRPIAGTPDPVLSPVSGTGTARPPQVIPPPPPVVSGTSLPGLIDRANGIVGGPMSPGGNSGCRDCSGGVVSATGTTAPPAPRPPAPRPPAPVVAPPQATPSALNFFDNLESSLQPSASGNRRAIEQFMLLFAKIKNYGLLCERHVAAAGECRTTTGPNCLENRVAIKWNEMAPLIRQYNTIMGGINQFDTQATAYMNRANGEFTRLGGSQRDLCLNLRSRFEALMRMNQSQITSYINQSVAQRSAALQTGQ